MSEILVRCRDLSQLHIWEPVPWVSARQCDHGATICPACWRFWEIEYELRVGSVKEQP